MSQREYLKNLHLFRHYLVKFKINSSSFWLSKDISSLINAVDTEIKYYQNEIKKRALKKSSQSELQLKYDLFNDYKDSML